jgi:hypothetical protein
MWYCERVISGRNAASLDTKARDADSERLGDFALIGLGPTASESLTSRRKCRRRLFITRRSTVTAYNWSTSPKPRRKLLGALIDATYAAKLLCSYPELSQVFEVMFICARYQVFLSASYT